MDPRSVPSGSDWALERDGALLLEGTVGATVSGCLFSRVETNAVFFSGFNRNGSVVFSEFAWLGQTAIAAWGRTDGPDGTGGEQPRLLLVEANVARELGVTQKQSSFFVSAAACQNTVRANLVYNVPRAALCFLDRFGGADIVERNLLFNTCRERRVRGRGGQCASARWGCAAHAGTRAERARALSWRERARFLSGRVRAHARARSLALSERARSHAHLLTAPTTLSPAPSPAASPPPPLPPHAAATTVP
jgi:hypothetical protein